MSTVLFIAYCNVPPSSVTGPDPSEVGEKVRVPPLRVVPFEYVFVPVKTNDPLETVNAVPAVPAPSTFKICPLNVLGPPVPAKVSLPPPVALLPMVFPVPEPLTERLPTVVVWPPRSSVPLSLPTSPSNQPETPQMHVCNHAIPR